MNCSKCGKDDIGEISFSAMGTDTTFLFCRWCENRWWLSESESVALSSILQRATVFARAS